MNKTTTTLLELSGATIWVLTFTSDCQTSIWAFSTERAAHNYLHQIVKDWWGDEMDGQPIPIDPKEAINTYFESMADRGEDYVLEAVTIDKED